jgi:alkylation response protein AidB-like acyl-CoA dehydrogenase
MQFFNFDPYSLPPEAEELRLEVRAFLAEEMPKYSAVERSRSWAGKNEEFSRKLAERGWIGMTWPKKYGGGERSFFERYAYLEEVLAVGAPVSAHWIADRQSGPLLLRYGTEDQRQRILPGITQGTSFFCIGMSEPDSGSDLASIRTKAEKVDGGYIVNGTKVWTSGAHRCNWMIALFRTDSNPEHRHDGMSQFLVPLQETKGVTISPIKNLAGEEHFNMVVFEDAFIAEENRVGAEGDGWKQVTAELAFERSGPERYMSSMQLLIELIREARIHPSERAREEIGRLVAHLATLRRMSLSVAGKLETNSNPALEASVVKDLGGVYEQQLPEIARRVTGGEASMTAASDYEQVRAYITQASVSFSLRGGAREILRGIIARGLGLR